MDIIPIDRARFPAWKEMRRALFTNLDNKFHEQEMEWIVTSAEMRCWLLVDAEGTAAGFVECSLRNVVDGCIGGPVGYVEALYVRPEHRGHGHSRRMLTEAEQWFRATGCKQIATDTELDNEAAQEFFRRLGFRESWRIVQFQRPIEPGLADLPTS
jgi:aminoglycoside 6'-N-acetyltransferase I